MAGLAHGSRFIRGANLQYSTNYPSPENANILTDLVFFINEIKYLGVFRPRPAHKMVIMCRTLVIALKVLIFSLFFSLFFDYN